MYGTVPGQVQSSQYDPYRRKYDEASIQYGERLAKTTIGTSGIMRTPSSF